VKVVSYTTILIHTPSILIHTSSHPTTTPHAQETKRSVLRARLLVCVCAFVCVCVCVCVHAFVFVWRACMHVSVY